MLPVKFKRDVQFWVDLFEECESISKCSKLEIQWRQVTEESETFTVLGVQWII
jgi:hypothetical protein